METSIKCKRIFILVVFFGFGSKSMTGQRIGSPLLAVVNPVGAAEPFSDEEMRRAAAFIWKQPITACHMKEKNVVCFAAEKEVGHPGYLCHPSASPACRAAKVGSSGSTWQFYDRKLTDFGFQSMHILLHK